MTILTIAQNVALSVGLEQPDVVATSTDRAVVELLQRVTDTCQEMARRVQWGDLTEEGTLTGDGTALEHDLPSGFDRLVQGVCVKAGGNIVRPLTQDEWSSLTMIEGTPRYFLLRDDKIQFYPFLANAATATVYYQSDLFVGGTASEFTSDTETPVFDERLVEIGTIARWRRQKGQPYLDYENEYEAALGQLAQFDDRGRF